MNTKHPLAVSPETVAQFRPRYHQYVLTSEDKSKLVENGVMTYPPITVKVIDPKRAASAAKFIQKRREKRILTKQMEQINKEIK